MKTELLPIIAAYLGQKCSYNDAEAELEAWWELANIEDLPNFKLHLRKLWSVTEAELIELGGILDEKELKVIVSIFNGIRKKQLKESYDYNCEYILEIQTESVIDYLRIKHRSPVKIVNYLRGKGFCCDVELIENDLVKWIDLD